PAMPAPGSSAKRPSMEAAISCPRSRSAAYAEQPNRAHAPASTTASAPTDSSTPTSSNQQAATGCSKASRPRSSAYYQSPSLRSPSGGYADASSETRRILDSISPSPRLPDG